MLGLSRGPSPRLQVWQVIFTVMTVDAALRSAGFAAKSVVLLAHPSAPEENFRRRSQVPGPLACAPGSTSTQRETRTSCLGGA